jgi:hypothetical protein
VIGIEKGLSPREIVLMGRWLKSEDGLKGKFFFERTPGHTTHLNPPVEFYFTDETTAMHFKLKYT